METRLRMYLAELFGTFVFVTIASGAICSAYLPQTPEGSSPYYALGGITLAAALADGLALAVAVSFTSFLSPGCCNPAITLALFITRKLDRVPTIGLLLAQLLGSFLAGLLIRGLYAEPILDAARMGAPYFRGIAGDAPTLATVGLGILLEAFFAFVVTMAAFATLIDRRAPKIGGFGIGLAQVAIVLFGFHLTGGSGNPARWFGPALWQLSIGSLQASQPLAGHAAYWAGPIVGAMAAAVLYVAVILPPERK